MAFSNELSWRRYFVGEQEDCVSVFALDVLFLQLS